VDVYEGSGLPGQQRMLIINADDWGRDSVSTDTGLACYRQGRISSTSAMVFMEDSERGADLAATVGIDTGLHINFTQRFNHPGCPQWVVREQDRIRRFLELSKYALLIYNPFLCRAFKSVFNAQLCEFVRIFGRDPSHFDGHQHMHLGSNMLFQRIIPPGVRVRRSFSFRSGEKSAVNRVYRRLVDRRLAQTYQLTESFFALSSNLGAGKLEAMFALAGEANVELMTHTWNQPEYDLLMSERFGCLLETAEVGSYARM